MRAKHQAFPERDIDGGLGFRNYTEDEQPDLYDELVFDGCFGGPYLTPNYQELDEEYGVA